MSKTKVTVLMGGMSSEHEVSMRSGAGVTDALGEGGYEPIPVAITRDGVWQFPDGAVLDIVHALPHLCELKPDCVFIALHGSFGEDGRLQGVLDTLGLPYTGSGCAASALAMDKVRCKAVVQAEGVPVGAHIAFGRRTWAEDRAKLLESLDENIGYPCVVKPPLQGSSVGVHILANADALEAAVEDAFRYDDLVMVEEMLRGVEVTASVLEAEEGSDARALPLTEIRPKKGAFFDYEAKYTPGASDEITPAEIDSSVAWEIKNMAVRVHHAVGCKGWSRSDFIVDGRGPVWLEVNTVPGLTLTSLFPQACAAAGITYAQMVGLFVEAAIREARAHK
jgi:D-alanine-D-alanine ligase